MTPIISKSKQETSLLKRIAYSGYFSGQNIVYFLIQTYLVTYYVSGLGISSAIVATVLLLARVWDAINDPLIGVLLDRIQFRNAKHKGWLNLTTFLVPLATLLIFTVPTDASQAVQLTYIITTYLMWDVLYTASEVPIFAVSTAMTKDEQERTLLLTLTQIGSVLGAVFATLIMDSLIGEGVDNINWLLAGTLPALVAFAVMLPQNFFVQERHAETRKTAASIPLPQMLRAVLQNDQHFWMMFFYISQTFLNAVTVFGIFVAEAFYGNPRLVTAASLFTLAGVILFGIFTPRLVRHFGKKPYLETMMLATIALSLPLFFIPAANTTLALLFIGLRSMTLITTSLLRPMFTADCIEYGEYKTGVRNDATAFAVQIFFNKVGDALGASLGALVLAWVMFDEAIPLSQQSTETINALQFWYVLLPMLMAVIMYIGPKLIYKLDEEQIVQFIRANEAHRQAKVAE